MKSSLLCFGFFSPVVETPLRVDVQVLKVRARLLQKYLCDEQKELQALYALQALVVTLEQPASKSQATGVRVGQRGFQIELVMEGTQSKRGGERAKCPGDLIVTYPTLCLFPCLQME